MADVHRTPPDCCPRQPSKKASGSSARWPVWTTVRETRAEGAYCPAVRLRWVPRRSLKSSSCDLRRLPPLSRFGPTDRLAERQVIGERAVKHGTTPNRTPGYGLQGCGLVVALSGVGLVT